MSEMVERVARVLVDLNPLANPDWTAWTDFARVIIAAMRDVTKEMAEAGAVELDNCTDSDWSSTPDGGREDYTIINSDAPSRIWVAMIDAELADAMAAPSDPKPSTGT